jgi:hypothetical protein
MTEDMRYSKQLLDYRPIERRRPGRLLNRPLEGYNREAETGHLLTKLRDQKKKKKKKKLHCFHLLLSMEEERIILCR